MSLAICIIVSLLGMQYIPANSSDGVAMTKMIVAVAFIALVWILLIVGRSLTG